MKRKGNILISFLSLFFLFVSIARPENKLPFELPKKSSELPQFAQVETTKGSFVMRFYREQAPVHVRNFEYLGTKGFYQNVSFHRYEPGFVIQGGDPKGDGKGGPGYTLPPEFSMTKHERGTVGMARLPDQVNPERRSSGSQFYVCLNRAAHLDGLYTVFAEVESGMDVVLRLRPNDRIIKVSFPSDVN